MLKVDLLQCLLHGDKWIYITLLSKVLSNIASHSHTHSYTDSGVNQGNSQLVKEQLGLQGVLLRDTSTLS